VGADVTLRARTRALDDQVLALVREWPKGLTADEIVVLLTGDTARPDLNRAHSPVKASLQRHQEASLVTSERVGAWGDLEMAYRHGSPIAEYPVHRHGLALIWTACSVPIDMDEFEEAMSRWR
jgi:hypothetical protein